MIEDYFMRLVQVGIAQTGANPIEAMDAYDRASKVRIPMDVDPLDAARHFLQYEFGVETSAPDWLVRQIHPDHTVFAEDERPAVEVDKLVEILKWFEAAIEGDISEDRYVQVAITAKNQLIHDAHVHKIVADELLRGL